MFADVLKLIMSAATKPADNRGSEETRDDILHILGTLTRFRTKPWRSGWTEPAARLVEGSAWPYLWDRIRHERGTPSGQLTAGELQANDQALKDHFQPNFEEIPHAG